jgi:cation diffusion facilitator CzcD-associated flavoprotein CzcO
MVPTEIVLVNAPFTLTPNGKVDRLSLRNATGKAFFGPTSPPSVSGERPRVCVIGGGVAGLLCALGCLQRGLDFVIMERESKFGGVWVNGVASPASRLQQPGEYYRLTCDKEPPFPCRFPTTSQLTEYFTRVAERAELGPNTRFGTEVVQVIPAFLSHSDAKHSPTDGVERLAADSWSVPPLCVTTRECASGLLSTHIFDAVISCTGLFQAGRAVGIPAIPGLTGFAGTVTFAHRLSSESLRGKRVVVLGGGPYAVEMVRVASAAGALTVTMAVRSPHWVFPTRWFRYGPLTRLFWKLLSGLAAPAIAKEARIALARQYARAGLTHMLPDRPFTDPKISVSDEWFDLHVLEPHRVQYLHATCIASEEQQLTFRRPDGGLYVTQADVVVLACGFGHPVYPFLSSFFNTPGNRGPSDLPGSGSAEMKNSASASDDGVYLGCLLARNPRVPRLCRRV